MVHLSMGNKLNMDIRKCPMLLLSLIACQQPFDADRHDLIGDRIVAIEARASDGGIQPTATLLRNGRLWTDDVDDLRWFALSGDPEQAILGIDPEAPDQLGPTPQFSNSTAAVGLWFRGERAWLELGNEQDLSFAGIAQSTLSKTLETQQAEDLTIEQRSLWTAVPTEAFAPGELGRFQADFLNPDANPTLRWMSTGGTFLELDRTTSDWAPATVTMDDDDVTLEHALSDGVFPLVALAVDPDHGNRVRIQEFHIGELPGGVRTSSGRWLPAEDIPASDWVWVTLQADDDTPTGLRLSDVEPATPDLNAEDPYGTEALACAVPLEGTFEPNVLVDGRCSRAQLIGHRVMIEVTP